MSDANTPDYATYDRPKYKPLAAEFSEFEPAELTEPATYRTSFVELSGTADAHLPVYKADAGKLKPRLLVEGFPHALTAVAEVATFGAAKYTENGWKSVPNGVQRYTDAMYRHLLRAAAGELHDKESGLLHHAHAAWNALAVLQLILEDTANPLRDKS